MGDPMDAQARKHAYTLTRRDNKYLPDFSALLQRCSLAVKDYNTKQHSTLGISPDAVWAQFVADGWQPVRLEQDDLIDLLPVAVRKVARGEVVLPWGRYTHPMLSELHGSQVRLHYDLAQGDRVWVADLSGRMLCVAERDANTEPFMPESYLDHARAVRDNQGERFS